jgi:hypothetical protein
MGRKPADVTYVTEIDPALSRKDGPLQALRSPGLQPAKGPS